jgi:CubicO group peptidase (beta-lactamase class C family)
MKPKFHPGRKRSVRARGGALILLVLWGWPLLSLTKVRNDPGKTIEESAKLERKVDAIFAPYDRPDSPGCAVGIVRNEHFVYERGYGMGSLELGVKLTPESVFYMGSISKQFTAASVVLAAEKGYLSLDDDVRRWIPELPLYGHTITLRQMLHHTSGIRDEIGLLTLAGEHMEDIHPAAEILSLLARQGALNFNPGDEYEYSNSNYFLLGEVVHRATGMPLSQFAAQNIFKPLGMAHTLFDDDRRLVVPGRVAAYSPRRSGGFGVDWSTNFDKAGDGGLMSSVDDLLLWDRNFYHNKLGRGPLVRELETRGKLNSGKTIDYALGLVVSQYRGLPIVEHGGALFGYRTEILRFPAERFSVICLCNVASANPGAQARQIADLYLSGQFPTTASVGLETGKRNWPAFRGEVDLPRFAGLYRDPADRSFVDVTVRGRHLAVRNNLVELVLPWNQPRLLTPAAAGLFVDPRGPAYRFEASAHGMRLTWSSGDGKMHVLRRIRPLHPTVKDLTGYAGDYISDELPATYKIRIQGRSLGVMVGWNPPFALEPSVHDEFRGHLSDEFHEPIVIQFRRVGERITGFDLFAGIADGVRDIKFVRKR